jgi:putative spermidine/putrescine transport system ATP-binding protein
MVLPDSLNQPARPAASTPGAPLALRELVKRYHEETAVDHVSLDVEGGEFVTFLGPSGSGKTTTLNMIAGFTEPTAGHIRMDGRAIEELPTHKRHIGVVFQHYALFPHLTVEENVAYPLKRRKVPKEQRLRQVTDALGMVRLDDHGKRYPRQLSGGQQQRVALARALVFRPRVLLMDEPLGALDKKLREWLQFEIKRLHTELGITFIYVTHDQEEALVLSDRIAVFNEGRIEQIGSAEQLYEHPRSLFVAEFLGDSNVFRGIATSRGVAWSVDGGGRRLPAPAPRDLADGAPGALVVRPERMRLLAAGEDPAPDENSVEGTVERLVYLGSSWEVDVRLGDGTRIHVKQSAGAGQDVGPGDSACVAWRVEHSTLLSDQAIDLERELERM